MYKPHVLGNFQDADKIDRGQMLKKSDIFNIQRQYGLRKAEKDDNDMTSVGMWVEENDGNVFFCFHPLMEENVIFILGKKTE